MHQIVETDILTEKIESDLAAGATLHRFKCIVYSRCPLSLYDLLRSAQKYEVYKNFTFVVAYEDEVRYKHHYKRIAKEFNFLWRFDPVPYMMLNSYMLNIFKSSSKMSLFLYMRENARFIRDVPIPTDHNYERRGLINLKKGIYSDMTESSYIRYQHDFESNPSMNGIIIGHKNTLNFLNGHKLQGHAYHFPAKSIELIGDPECEY